MNRSEFEHIVRASADITGEKDFIIIGSQSILGKVPDAPRELRDSVELDIYPRYRPEMSEMIDGAIGEMSQFHNTHNIYAHGIGPGTATLPQGWESRLIEVSTQGTGGAIAWCLDPHDLAYSKLVAGREKDTAFVVALRRHKLIRPIQMRRMIRETENIELNELLSGRWEGIETRISQRRGR